MSCSHIKSEVKTEEEDLINKSGGFLCPACGEQLLNEKYLIEHIRERHYKPDLQVQDGEHSLQRELTGGSVHKNGHVTEQDGCCAQNKSEVKTEQSEFNEEAGGFLCSVCGEQYAEEASFIKHIYDHINTYGKRKRPIIDEFQSDNGYSSEVAKPVSCTIFQKNPNSQESDNLLKCPDCLYSTIYKSNLRVHMMTHSGEKPHKCSECSYATIDKSHLRVHMRTHSGEKPYKCSDCSYAAAQKSDLKVHIMMNHSGEKPHKCSECSYATANKSHLRVHMMTHSGEKPYKCSDCSYAAARKSDLKVHMMTHSGEKPHKCSDCSYAAVHKSHLRVHMMTHSGEKPYKCSDCSYAAARKSDLKVHLKTHSGEKPFKCSGLGPDGAGGSNDHLQKCFKYL